MTEHISKLLEQLPLSPGVYEMKNTEGETLYVGKAKNLKNRVRSYFQNSKDHSMRIKKLIEKIDHIEWTETRTEVEALILENNLIKEKYPKFNILLRDDKTYAYIKITNEDFPRVQLVRKVLKDGAKYFGPKISTSSVRQTIDLLHDLFKFRSTPIQIDSLPEGKVEVSSGNQKYPCLNYHLKKCDAPCVGNISKTEYAKKVVQAVRLLKGDTKETIEMLHQEMMDWAKSGKYELAAKLRDKIQSIESISEKQIISAPDDFCGDVIGVYSNFGHVFFHVFSLREGKVINSETFSVQVKNESSLQRLSHDNQKEAIDSFLKGHVARVSDIPKTIILDQHFINDEEKELWEKFFTSEWGKKIEIILPQKGKKNDLLQLAHQNAESYATRHAMSFMKNDEQEEETLQTLKEKLGMKNLPSRIECYDISHFSGEKTVASMVVFEDGKAKNKDYRSFNIKTLDRGDIDDFKSLAEALSRRLAHLPEKFPNHWNIGKLSRKKDFIELTKLRHEHKAWTPLDSKISFKNNVLTKNKESAFYGFFESTEIKMGNKPSKISKVFNPNISVCVSDNDYWEEGSEIIFLEGDGKIDMQQIRFFCTSLFQKLKKQEYKVRVHNIEIQEYLKSIGFEEQEHGEFWKQWFSNKNNSFVKKPNLLVIDGGKGQLSSTWEILKTSPFAKDITICSLAKKEEEVFTIKESQIIKTDIEKNSPEGHLLQRIRDEAHRFAITKNRIGREKNAQKSILDEIHGIGPKTKKLLKTKFGGVAGIRNTSDEELLHVVSKDILKKLREKI